MRTALFTFFAFTIVPAIAPADEPVDFVRDVKPIFERRCFACHGPIKQEAALRLDAGAFVLKGGESGAAVKAGAAAESLLIERVGAADESFRMPPEGAPLTADEIALITRWIQEGAKVPADDAPAEDPRRHWSFQPPIRPPVPVVKDAAWVRNPIDAFIAAEHQKRNLEPRPHADQATFLRRVYLDLVGLPPSREELHAFLNDASPDAYEKVVERLLNSPRYGERWGRHWMDVWRYSDWYGRRGQNEIRYSQRHIWRWRDWIIESLNADKGYDRMLLEMLAGDEVAPADPDVVRATGFLCRNWYKFDRDVWLFETVERTSEGLLALTMKCARCHDHKYDPVSQQEYYQLRAFFEPHGTRTDPLAAGVGTERDNGADDVLKDGLSRVFDEKPDAPTYLYQRGDSRQPDKEHPLSSAVPAVLAEVPVDVEPVALPVESYYPALRPQLVEQSLAKSRAEIAATQAALKQAGESESATAERLAKFDAGELKRDPASDERTVLLADDFTVPRPDVWEVKSGTWQHKDGQLVEIEVGNFLTIVTREIHPQDFAARVRYTTTEAGSVRSVGMSFDVVELRDWQAIYTHTNDGGSALHAFHRQNGGDVYPSNAIVPHPLRVGQEITLDFAVRGALLNIWIDGELKLAYKMPLPRQAGRFALWVHDGTAAFDELRIEALPESFSLAESATQAIRSPFAELARVDLERAQDAARHAIKLAEAQTRIAEAELATLEARINAERAKIDESENLPALATQAGQAEARLAVAKAELELLKAEQEMEAQSRVGLTHQTSTAPEKNVAGEAHPTSITDKQRAEAEKKVTAARQALEKTQAAAEQPSDKYTPLGPVYPQTSTGRRSALARWVVDPRNPRTARVAVNHLWLRHFGEAIVPSVANFGLNGQPPSHPELLDWLAVELIENGWSMKHLHRLMVTSATYRMASSSGPADHPNLAVDPENRYLWRMNFRRMEAEVVRDAMLSSAGELDAMMGGPELDESLGPSSPRRSLYFRLTPDNKMELLELFNLANPNECYRRQTSVVPQQALALTNSGLALSQSRLLARRLSAEINETEPDGADNAFIVAAFEQVLNRRPTPEESTACLKFLNRHERLLSDTKQLRAFPPGPAVSVPPSTDPHLRACENLLHMLFSHNDFVTIR